MKVIRLTDGHLDAYRLARIKIRTHWPDTNLELHDFAKCNLLLFIVWVK